MTPTPEMFAMAERIAGDPSDPISQEWEDRRDAVLAAIMEVSEKAANFAENSGYVTCAEFVAPAIRNGEHLR